MNMNKNNLPKSQKHLIPTIQNQCIRVLHIQNYQSYEHKDLKTNYNIKRKINAIYK